MKPPTTNSAQTVSSATGRHWLEASKEPPAALDSNPSSPVAVVLDTTRIEVAGKKRSRAGRISGRNQVHITSVSIPDVSALPASISHESVHAGDAQAIAKTLAQASEDRLNSLVEPTTGWNQSKVLKDSSRGWSEVADPIDRWVTQPADSEQDRKKSEPPDDTQAAPNPTQDPPPNNESLGPLSAQASSSKVTPFEAALSGVVESILERSAVGQPLIFVFLGSQQNEHVDSTTSTIAAVLGRRGLGPVLLVDGNSTMRRLSLKQSASRQDGVVETLMESRAWKPLVRTNHWPGVDFLPAGQRKLGGSNVEARLVRLVSEFKRDYAFICVSVGESDSVDGKFWSEVADGCYLLVSQSNANPALAQSAVAELRASGARLLGCVATDTDSRGL